MKTQTKSVGYFYPTSTNAQKMKMPAGGYGVSITTYQGERFISKKCVAAFADKDAALAHAESLPQNWDFFSIKPTSKE